MPKHIKILIAILIAIFIIWIYAAIEPFIYHFTGFGFIWGYSQDSVSTNGRVGIANDAGLTYELNINGADTISGINY